MARTRPAQAILLFLFVLAAAPLGARAQAPETRRGSASGSASLIPLEPDTTFRTAGGVEAVLLSNRTSGLTAFALAVRMQEEPGEEGTTRLLAELARRRVAGVARRVGAAVTVEAVPFGLLYAVSGPEEDADYLAYLLRLATGAPEDDEGVRAEAYEALRRQTERAREDPVERLVSALIRQATNAPDPGAAAPPTSEVVRAVWWRTHRPPSMTLVVESGLPLAALIPAFGPLGVRADATPGPAPSAAPPAPDVRADPPLRRWIGEAWVDPAPFDPRAEVAAAYLGEQLRAAAPSGGEAELAARVLRLRDRAVLVLTGAALPRAVSAVRARISGVMAAARRGVESPAFARARARVRLQLRDRLATPLGRVTQVALGLGLTNDAHAAARALDALERLTAGELVAYLRALPGPYVEELRP